MDPGESLDEAIVREFREETGYTAKRMMVWKRKTHTGLIRYEQALYIATDLEQGLSTNLEQDGERIELVPTKWEELVTRCLKADLRQPDVMLSVVAMHYDPEQRARLDAFLSGRA